MLLHVHLPVEDLGALELGILDPSAPEPFTTLPDLATVAAFEAPISVPSFVQPTSQEAQQHLSKATQVEGRPGRESSTVPASPPNVSDPWRPSFLLEPGRLMTAEDHILRQADPLVIEALG